MNIELKSIKVYPSLSEETTAFNATLYVDRKKTALVENTGKGGCNSYYPTSAEAKEWLDAAWDHARKVETEFNFDQLDILISKMLVDHEYQKLCKNHIVVRLKSKPHMDALYKGVFSAKAIEMIKNEHGDDIEEIVNFRFAQPMSEDKADDIRYRKDCKTKVLFISQAGDVMVVKKPYTKFLADMIRRQYNPKEIINERYL